MHYKSVSTYFIFNVLSALIPIFAIPFLTRYLTPEEFGLFTVFTVISMFAGNIFRLELNMALKREYVDNPKDFSKFISTAFVFSTFMLIPYCLIVFLAMPFVDTFYEIPLSWMILIILLSYFRSQIINLHHLWQITNKALPYGIWGLIATASVFVITIILILFKSADWQSRAWAEWIIGLISLLIAVYFLRKDYALKWRFEQGVLTKMLRYSLPLLPSTLMGYIFLVSDRIFITEFGGMYELGLYSVAVQIAGSVGLIYGAILPAWESWIYTKLGSINRTAIRIIFMRLFIIILLSALMMTILPQILKFLMPYLTGKSFASAEAFLFPCLLSAISAGFFSLCKTPLLFMRRTTTIAYIDVSMLVINVICMYFFVSQMGAIGAAYALAITFTYGSLLQLFFVFRFQERILVKCP